MRVLRRFIEFLVYSNVYLSLGAAIVALATIFLMEKQVVWELLLIPFSGSFLIYNFNRFTDLGEDQVNIPERHIFVQKYGRGLLIVSILFYLASLYLAFTANLYVLAFTLLPVAGAVIYSYFRFKKFFLIKNLIVSLSWGISALLVGAYFQEFSLLLMAIYVFFSLQFLINVIIFDIKDIRGDSLYKIETLPDKVGVERTKKFCFFIIFLLILTCGFILTIDLKGLVLVPALLYIFFFIKKAEKHENSKWWYYGVFVDGEFLILLTSIVIWWILRGL